MLHKPSEEEVTILEKKLAGYIRQNDYDAYVAARYPDIADYEELVFTEEDFSNIDFDRFPVSMNIFRKCNLNRAKLSPGQPIYIEDCSAIELSVKGVSAVIFAKNTDFTGLQYNNETVLARPENSAAGCSQFEHCIIDPDTTRFMKQQGVVIEP